MPESPESTADRLRSAAAGVYWLTPFLAVGRFVTPKRVETLLASGVTHVLNVGEAPPVDAADRLQQAWHPIVDLTPMPIPPTIEVLGVLHSMACTPSSRVYVHCIAGQNRSPTIVWLYFVACGVDPDLARARMELRTIDAVPGHSTLVYDDLIQAVREWGQETLVPHPRPEFLQFC